MNPENLQIEIDKKGEEQVSKIIGDAKEEARGIIEEANSRASALKVERTKSLTNELNAKEVSELSALRMKEKAEILRLRHEWMNRSFEEAEKRIALIAEKGAREYQQLLAALILEGVSKLKGNKFVVGANSRDLKLIKDQLTAITENASQFKNEIHLDLQPSEVGRGGVVVSTVDGRQYYNNTLDARLAATRQNFAGEVNRILFGETTNE
ncbi:MAG TPA: V-type ATP synthase subunit E family protein [Candidatus Acidoferrales bacterium]|nr:V-type ATP synthase subunit E family protein [Candidatus Acidoferrales bacterium]